MMSLVTGPNAESERNTLTPFSDQLGYRFQYLPSFESDNRAASYQQLFRERSPQPDLLEIDVIWPALFADDLVDLTPYVGDDIKSIPAEALKAYTVGGRLLAVPIYIDTGLLYYRSDLLKKYRFAKPPQTWDELEHMASVIQRGERNAGKKDFWGFVWPGSPFEGLTCNALEWFSSQGAGHILEPDRTIRVYNRNSFRALERAASWVGTITPPGVTGYTEDDSINVWQAGHAAFLRSWANAYNAIAPTRALQDRLGVTGIPGGSSGKVFVLGGAAIAVSQYSEHREAAIAALRHLINSSKRAAPQNPAGLMTAALARPSSLASQSYSQVSRAYFEAVHSVLTHQSVPEKALAKLERQLVQLTGFRAVRD